jgi:PPP family 3-phenylpropionic acid transporter
MSSAPNPVVSDIADEPPPLWRRVALAFALFLLTGTFGFLQPFVSLYMQSAGLNKTQFGAVMALGTATVLLFQPLLGRLSDYLPSRRPVMFLAAICAGCAYSAYRYADGFWGFLALTAVGVNGFQYLNAASGALVGQIARSSGGGAAYVRYRVWGSVGYIVVAVGAGFLVNQVLPKDPVVPRAILDPLFLYGPLVFFALAGVVLLAPEGRRSLPPIVSAPLNVDEEPLQEDADHAARQRIFNHFLIALGLYQFSLYGASAYLPYYMRQLGASPLMITGMFAAGVLCEVLVMRQVGRWTDKFGRRPALAASLILMPIRLLLYIPATGPLWVLCVQMLHGINFGIVGTIAVVVINDLARDHERGAAQARLAVVGGLCSAVGPFVCGYLSDHLGIRPMFALMSLVGMVSVIYFLKNVRESNPSAIPPHGILRYLA